MWRRWCCWSGKARKSKGFGVLGGICRCAFGVDWGVICFLLPWWGKENERFGKRLEYKYNVEIYYTCRSDII